jgi:hypothetical protein
MTAFANLGFETVGASAGLASGWTSSFTGTAAVLPDLGGAGDPTPVEGFETGWDTNEDYLFTLGVLDVTIGQFNTGANATAYEDFEIEWLNDAYLFTLGSAIAAAFTGSGDTEGFETGWDTNESYLFTLAPGDITAVSLTGGATYENMETGWDNDTYLTTLSGTTAASFDGTGAAAEAFTALLAPFSFSVASSVLQAAAHPVVNDNRVKFQGSGLPPEIIVGLTYYVINKATNTFQVSLTLGGAAVSLTNSSATTMACYGDPAVFWTESYD